MNKLRAIFAIIFGMVAIWTVSLSSKPVNPAITPTEKAEDPVGISANEILDKLPATESKTDTDKTLTAMIGKVRAEPDKSYRWVALGDVLAQKLRDTTDQNYLAHVELTYLQALKLDPKDSDAMTGMSWVTGNRHIFDQSIHWAEKALAIQPNHVAAFGILGDAALELGDYDKAFDCYQKMADLRPDLSSWSRAAYLIWVTGDSKKAIWLMEKAIKAGAPFGENTAWCRAKLAMMYFHSGELLAAKECLEPVLTKDTHNPHVLLAACKIAASNHDYPAALAYCDKLLEAGPNHEALVIAGDLHSAMGEFALAQAYYEKVMKLHAAQDAKGAHDHMQMARFYADHDRHRIDAIRLAEEHQNTHNVMEADVLAWVYFKNGNLSRASVVMRLALSQNTPDPEILYHAGMIAAATGDKQAARTYLEQALAWNPAFNVIQAPIARKALNALMAEDLTTTDHANSAIYGP